MSHWNKNYGVWYLTVIRMSVWYLTVIRISVWCLTEIRIMVSDISL